MKNAYFQPRRNLFLFKNLDYSFIAFLLLVCGIIAVVIVSLWLQATGIKAGYIYEKDYTPAHCNTTYIDNRPHVICYSESYTLYIEDMVNDERATNWHETTPEIYHEAKIGQWYDNRCDCLEDGKP